MPCGLSAQIPLEMTLSRIIDPYSADTTYFSMAVRIDPADYVQQNGSSAIVAAHFQACLKVTANPPRSVQLVDENGTVYATITNASVSDWTRIRGSFTVDPVTPHEYQFKTIANALDNARLFFQDCKILLNVENAARVKIQFLLAAGSSQGEGGNEASANANNQAAWAFAGASFAYDYFGLPAVLGGAGTEEFLQDFFLKDESKFATIEDWELEVSGFHYQNTPCGCAANCKAALWNTTTNQMVTGSELGPWSPGSVAALPEIKRITFLNTAANFTNGHEFTVKHILAPDGLPDPCEFRVMRAALYVTLTGLAIKAQVFHKLSRENFAEGSKEHKQTRYLHEPTKYNAGTTFFHEVSGKVTTAGTGTSTSTMKDVGTSDVATAGSDVAGSAIVFGAVRTRQRTAALTLTDGNRYYGVDTETGTARLSHGHQFLIAEIPAITCPDETEEEEEEEEGVIPEQDEDCGCGAFWRSGYFGLDQPGKVKMMRHSKLVTDGVGFKIKRYLVDDTHPVTQPKIIEPTVQGTTETTEKFATNLKARGESIEIQFPCDDEPRSVLRLDHTHIPVSER